jgi:hypothetical protein
MKSRRIGLSTAAAPPKKPIGRHIVPTFPQQFVITNTFKFITSPRRSLERGGVNNAFFLLFFTSYSGMRGWLEPILWPTETPSWEVQTPNVPS